MYTDTRIFLFEFTITARLARIALPFAPVLAWRSAEWQMARKMVLRMLGRRQLKRLIA
jgi:hypothetical protein